MFNRRELIAGLISSPCGHFLKPLSGQFAKSHLDDFLVAEAKIDLSAEVMKQLRWGKAGVLSVFSPDMAFVLTVRSTDNFATLWDAGTAAELAVLARIEVERGENIQFDVAWIDRPRLSRAL
jgi:hypothetical protein